MVGQVRPGLLLTDKKPPADAPVLAAQVILMQAPVDGFPEQEPPQASDENGPAYVVFTSGTTGAPNAVTVSRRSLWQYIGELTEALKIVQADTCLHTASFAFSASMRQLFEPLWAGAKLVVADDLERLDPVCRLALMREQRVTVWDTVPSVLLQTIECFGSALPSESSPQLRLVTVTGEAFGRSLAMTASDLLPQVRLTNLYSHSETTGTVSMFEVPAGFGPGDGSVSLGWPAGESALYVLDENRQPVTLEDEGEIWVGSSRLADGYVGQPDLTAVRFAPDPFRGVGRMFCTGDRGRVRADGAIEFIGRTDDRLNIRAHRVEPGDVEAALREHPGVSQALVTGRLDPAGDLRLVAYVVLCQSVLSAAENKRRYLLPNKLAVVHVNKHETDFTDHTIFEDQTYLEDGIEFRDGDFIFDVGANIGLFSLFATLACNPPRIFAFEPNPTVREALCTNLQRHDVDARVFPFGLSGTEGNVPLQELVEGHFDADSSSVPVRTLSSVIDDKQVDRIDLLKINAGKSEWRILAGIRPEHWPLISQLVIKSERIDRVDDIVELAQSRGFDCAVRQEESMAGSGIQTLYGVRAGSGRRLRPKLAPGDHRRSLSFPASSQATPEELRVFLTTKLPEPLVPTMIELLERLPVNANGKLDRAGLLEPDWAHVSAAILAPPETPLEETLAEIWRDVLGVERVGRHDEFLALGGDSSKAIRVLNRLRDQLSVALPISTVFSASTLVELAEAVRGELGGNPGEGGCPDDIAG